MKSRRRPLVAAGIIERHDNDILIVRPVTADDQARVWQFPRGLAAAEESAEAAMCRIAREQLGVDVEIIVGQPPLVQPIDGKEVEARYFFCGILDGEPCLQGYAELRWIPKSHLREYDFDRPSAEVVKWLLET